MKDGWIKLYRNTLSNGWLQNPRLWVFWSYCLLKASYKRHKVIIGFQEIELEPGQFIFGRKKAAKDLKMSEQSVRTCVSFLEKAGNLTIKTTNKFSLLTVANWSLYQDRENETNHQTNQQLTSNQPATNHQLTTYKNVKNDKNVRKKEKNIYTAQAKEIIEYLNLKAGKKFKPVPSHLKLISARLKEGYTVDNFKRVIDIKTSQWLNTEREWCLRPITLFGDKFDSYLNERECPKKVERDKINKSKVELNLEVGANDEQDEKPMSRKERIMAYLNQIDNHLQGIGDNESPLSVFEPSHLNQIEKHLDPPTLKRIKGYLEELQEAQNA